MKIWNQFDIPTNIKISFPCSITRSRSYWSRHGCCQRPPKQRRRGHRTLSDKNCGAADLRSHSRSISRKHNIWLSYSCFLTSRSNSFNQKKKKKKKANGSSSVPLIMEVLSPLPPSSDSSGKIPWSTKSFCNSVLIIHLDASLETEILIKGRPHVTNHLYGTC